MAEFEVPQAILNSPFEEPQEYWYLREGHAPEQRQGRRPAIVYPPRNQTTGWDLSDGTLAKAADYPGGFEMKLVNRIREALKKWREAGTPGASSITQELMQWWRRDGRRWRLFFTQLEAAETIIFMREARADFLQGLTVPREQMNDDGGYAGFQRYACKMATGSGKTTVMGMLAAWSILNKVNDRGNANYSDTVLVVCPNVTIRNRLAELNPKTGDASLYVTRDLVPPDLRKDLSQGNVIVTNWHVFEPKTAAGDVSAKVVRTGRPVRVTETIRIGKKTTTMRGSRYLSLEDYQRQVDAGMLDVIEEHKDRQGNLVKVTVESTKYVESDTSVVKRALEREAGGKQNILVMNDEAHHAYRIRREAAQGDQQALPGMDDDADDSGDDVDQAFVDEATVWVEGLDRINKLRGVNFCVDLSATPYFLGRVGQDTNRPFPWVVSDFSLVDAIESGLTKVPQLAVRDTTGAEIPGYFNIWQWIMEKLTPAERGGKKASPKPEAVLKWAHTPVALLAGLWEELLAEWRDAKSDDQRPPVFILVCKNTRIAKVIYEWLAEDKPPTGVPSAKIAGFKNTADQSNTIRVDTKVVQETDDLETAKSDEVKWMRHTLDTVGKRDWPKDSQGRPIYAEGFDELAKKLGRPLHPPGRDIRCIVSVGMLTEGWDCQTVTHIIGLRPFMSQLLCEQVVGRGLRRTSYEVNDEGKFDEEVAKVFGVPFDLIPFKAASGAKPKVKPRRHIHAIPQKAHLEIKFPRVEGYTQAVRNRVTVNWDGIAKITLEPGRIPPEVEMKGLSVTNEGRMSLSGPGNIDDVTLAEFRASRRRQELEFDLARTLTREFAQTEHCTVPTHALFPQMRGIVEQYLDSKVSVTPRSDIKDVFLAPYYGWVVERLVENIRGDTSQGEAPEIPRYESNRPPGTTADVDYWTSREVREVNKSHLNYVVADTRRWEQQAAYYIDKHPRVFAFAKNAGLNFAIPYLHNGQKHDYLPDFIIKLVGDEPVYLILETKGWDPLEDVKREAALRWCAAVNADGSYGRWEYRICRRMAELPEVIGQTAGVTVP